MTERRGKRSSGLRTFGCLFQGAAGCGAFFFGLVAVALLLLPPTAGTAVAGQVESEFAERYRGSLELDDPWLFAFFGEQRIRAIRVRDPEGRPVVSGSFRAPSFGGELVSDDGHYGPVELFLDEVDVVYGADGRTNLARAFERRSPERGRLDLQFDLQPGDVFEVALVVTRLRVRREGGSELVELRDFRAQGELRTPDGHARAFELRGDGEVVTDLSQAEAGRLGLRAFVEDVSGLPDPRRASGRVDLTLEGVPAERLGLLAGRELPELGAALAPRLQSALLTLDHHGRAGTSVSLAARSDTAELELAGWLERESHAVVARREEDLARVSFAAGSPWGQSVLKRLVPPVSGLGDGGEVLLVAKDFSLPLEGGPAGLSGELAFHFGQVSYALAPELAANLALDVERFEATGTQLHVSVEHGVVHYRALPLAGGELTLDGRYDLSAGVPAVSVLRAGTPIAELGAGWAPVSPDGNGAPDGSGPPVEEEAPALPDPPAAPVEEGERDGD